MVRLVRGLMLLIPISPSCSSLFLSPTMSSFLCRPWEPSIVPRRKPVAFGPIHTTVSTVVLRTNAWIFNPTRAFHALSKSERGAVEAGAEVPKAEKPRVGKVAWKRNPVFGVPDGPKWTENRRETVQSGSEDFSWSRVEVANPQRSRRARERETRERENRGQRQPSTSLDDSNTRGSVSDLASGQRQGLSRISEPNGRPPLKPKANYYDTVGKSQQEGDGGISQANQKLPFKPKANYYDTVVKSQQGGDGEILQANRKLPFKPKANYYDTVGKSQLEGQGGRFPFNRRPPSKPKANYYDTVGKSQSEGGGGNLQANRRPPFKPKANYYDTVGESRGESGKRSSVTSARVDHRRETNHSSGRAQPSSVPENGRVDGEYRNREPAFNSAVEQPHYAYKFRKSGTELGEFRRISPVKRSGGSDRDGGRSGTELGVIRRISPVKSSGGSDAVGGRFDFQGNGASAVSQPAKNESDIEIKPIDAQPPPDEYVKYPPQRLQGEKRWQYAVRKKQLARPGHSRGSTRKSTEQFADEEGLGNEPQGEEWRRKKIGWLCKEIPKLKPRLIVSILNEQRNWINAVDIRYIVEHLLQINEILRSHRVLKWEMQQTWYEFDYDLSIKVAVKLGESNKLSRTRDMFDMIIRNGKVPDLPTYVSLINCYIADGENESFTQAWSLFNQLTQLGGHEPPPTLRYNLFQGFMQKGLTYLEQAHEVFDGIKMAGLVASTEMYSLLIHAHGTKGNQDRVDNLIKEMREAGLPIGQDVYAAILRACAQDGNVALGEQAYADLKMAGYKPIPVVYSSLIKLYGKAGLPEKAFQTFEEMRKLGVSPNLIVYEPIIEVAVLSGNREQAEKLLSEAQERGVPSLHSSYNALMGLYSKEGLLEELETTFKGMASKGYPPNQASFNVLLEAYMKHRIVEKAETVFEDMKKSGKIKPNKRTFELMIQLYGEVKKPGKIKEVFKELANRKMDVPEGSANYLKAALSPKQLGAHRNSKLQLDRVQRELLAGVLLGGAVIESHDKNRTYELHFGLDPDNEVHLPLFNHLYEQFADWSTEAPKRQPFPDPKDPTKSKILLAFQTVSHGSFRFFAHQYRPNHHAVIPRLVHRWLTPRALAYWYMYGGTKCPDTGDILFNASAYHDKEIMLVVNALKSRTIDCEKRKTKEGLAICFNGRSAIWLWGLMEPYILPEVKALLSPEGEVKTTINNQGELVDDDSLTVGVQSAEC